MTDSSYGVAERCEFHQGDIIESRNDSYRVEKELGEGTFGIVYKVTNRQGQVAALKLLKLWAVMPELCKGLKERFLMEFETGKVKSKHLAHSFDYGEMKNNPFFVMEYCPNGDLRGFVSRHRVDFVQVGCDILTGLGDLHSCGKVHRDLKPENVLMRGDGTAVLTDFGIAGDQNKRMTERGIVGKPKQLFGTYPYMPPEQVNPPRGGKATVLPTTDIFSFGVMMYEMIVGKLPFGPLANDSELSNYLENGKRGIWDRQALKRYDPSGKWMSVIDACLKPDYKQRVSSTREIICMLGPSQHNGYGSVNVDDEKDYMAVRNGILLRVMQGTDYGKTYRLNDYVDATRRLVTLGRKDDSVYNDISINDLDSFISRCHCTIEWDGFQNSWIIRDGQWRCDCPIAMRQKLGCIRCTAYCAPNEMRKYPKGWKKSMNGTHVNSTEVDDKNGFALAPGDIITVGDIKLRVEGY